MQSSIAPERLLLSARDAAKALSISERTLWTLTHRGTVPCIKFGARTLYSVKALQELIDGIIAEKKEGGAA